jgi:uncharacterized protein (TIGR03083 family)
VKRYAALSHEDLIAQLDAGAREFADHFQSLDPLADAAFAVSWAGDARSPNWFHTARELTERWHHQQQIRLAAGRPGIMSRELYHPVLDTFMRALPFAYRGVIRPAGTLARITVTGEAGGTWSLYRDADAWTLIEAAANRAASETVVPQEIAWRIFTKGISREEARAHVRVSGDADLGSHVLGATAIVG